MKIIQKIVPLVPDFLKPILRPPYKYLTSTRLYWWYKSIGYKPKRCEELHQYWREPWDGSNLPAEYLTHDCEARSKFLVQLIQKYASQGKILEIGCNAGRNLNYLFLAGFKELSGVEISENACQVLRQTFPEMAMHTQIHNKSIEEIIRDFRDGEFDVVFTMATFEHIPRESIWIFPEVVRIAAKFLVTVEDEHWYSWRHFPRNYKKIFEPLGMKQVEGFTCDENSGLPLFVARVFMK